MTEPRTPESFVLDTEHPWPGLREFDEQAESFFNGRQRETAALSRLAREATLTVLLGRSGLGKTSLLLAGLFPVLRREHYLPVYVRINPRDRADPLIEQVRRVFFQQLQGQGVEHPASAAEESLWEYLHRDDLEFWSGDNRLLTPLFVFDQFEELFTLGEENAGAVGRFREDLADLIENRMPGQLARELEMAESHGPRLNVQSRRYKVLLSFREDFLPDVEGWRLEIPSLSSNRLRLLPLDGLQAFDAVFKTGGDLVDNEAAEAIVRFVAAARVSLENPTARGGADTSAVSAAAGLPPLESVTVEPALLSLVCTGLNERRRATPGSLRIDRMLLEGTGLQIVTEFYEKSVADLPSRARRFIENELITESGFRNPYPREEALSQGIVSEEELERLVKRRLLRIEPQMGIDRIELIHDLLTAVVRASRDREREQQRLEQQRLEQRQQKSRLQEKEELQRQQLKATFQRKMLVLTSLVSLVFIIATVGIYKLYAENRAKNKKVQSLYLVLRSRDVLDDKSADKQTVTSELSLQLAATAYRLDNENKETVSSLQNNIIKTRRLVFLMNHDSEVTCLAYRPDNDRIVSGDKNGTLTVYDAATGRQIGEPLQGHEGQVTSVAFSPDGQLMVSAGVDATVRLWDAKTGTSSGEPFKGHTGKVISVAFSPDSRLIASAGVDATVRLWDAKTGTSSGEPLRGHTAPVLSVAFSPDGRSIASAGYDDTMRLWDAKTGKPFGEPLKGNTGGISSVVFSPDGRLLASSGVDATVRMWNVATRKPFGEPLRGHKGMITSIAFNPEGTRLASAGSDKTVRLWDGETGTPSGDPLTGHERDVYGVVFSPDGRRLASAGSDGTVRVWDAESISRISTEVPVAGIAINPDGTKLASCGYNGSVQLWDLNTGKPVFEPLPGHEGPVNSVTFSKDGTSLASGGYDGTVRLWNVSTGKPSGEPLRGAGDPVTSVAFSPDGTSLASGSFDKTVRLWNLSAGEPNGKLLQGHDGPVTSVAFNPDGASLASASNDKTVRRWDAHTGKPIGEPLLGHESGVAIVAFSPDGTWLVSGGYDKTVRLWNASTGKPVGEPLRGHEDKVTSIVFSPDSKRIVSGSDDRSVRLWDVSAGKSLGQPLLGHEGPVTSVAFSPDERLIASGSLDRTVRFWDGRLPSIDMLCAKLTRNMSKKQWRNFMNDEPYLVQCRNLPVPEKAQ